MSQRVKGMLFLLNAGFFFALMSSFVKLAGDLPTPEKVFFRNIIMFVLTLIAVLRGRDWQGVSRRGAKFLLMRALAGSVAVLCNFYAIDHLNLADSNMHDKLAPFFGVFFSCVLLGEEVKLPQVIALAAAFVGALFIIKPSGANLLLGPSLVGAAGGVIAGLVIPSVCGAAKTGVSKSLIMLTFSAVCSFSVLPSMLLHYAPISPRQLLMLLACSVCGTIGQFSITTAYAIAPARDVSVFEYSQPVFSTIIGFFLFDQMPDGYSFVGYALILGAGIFMFFNERKMYAHENDIAK